MHSTPGVRSPSANGFTSPRPGSVSHGGHGGSTGNITADLIRDLKAKEAEVDNMKNREVWMKAALSKASRSGFVYEDRESGEGELGLNGDDQNGRRFGPKFQAIQGQDAGT
jgi:hypothetical protein